MQLLYDLAKQYDYERYVCALFVGSKDRLKLLVVIALCGEISRIPNISSEEMVVLVRLKWWAERFNNLQDCASSPPLLQSSREILQNNPQLLHEMLNFCEIVAENSHNNSLTSVQAIMRQYFKLLSIAADEVYHCNEYAKLANYFSEIAALRVGGLETEEFKASLKNAYSRLLSDTIEVEIDNLNDYHDIRDDFISYYYARKLSYVAKLWDKQLNKQPSSLKINNLALKLLLG
jgi:hypothetical protein